MNILKYISAAGKLFYSSLLWNKSESSSILYLTFDDGPIPGVTPWVLSLLKEYDAKATFFCIGENIRKYPEIFQQILAEGHTIGNHTFNHYNGWKTSTEDYVQNVLLAEEAITENINSRIPNEPSGKQVPSSNSPLPDSLQQKSENRKKVTENEKSITENRKQKTENRKPRTNNKKLFRPPYGRFTPSQIKELKRLGYTIVMWDVISQDYDQKISEEECFQEVVSQAGPGSIVVFHDSEKASENLMGILPCVLEYFKDKGYSLESL